MKPPHKGQTTIPVPNETGREHSPDELYAREYGADKLADQRRLYAEARACTCASAWPRRWGRAFHKQPCPRAGRKF